jgi:hydrogenase maturation protein HypF
MIEDQASSCLFLHFFGHVQGVGMRPFLFRIAHEFHLTGNIYNHNQGVTAELEGQHDQLMTFHRKVLEMAPEPIEISECRVEWKKPAGFAKLEIITLPIDPNLTPRHALQPDASTCKTCWADFFDPQSRFFGYPFVTCSECGPRWTILKRFPFERCNTSYSSFKMCPDCEKDYQNPQNRRHHAQTISCRNCGPQISLQTSTSNSPNVSLESLGRLLKNGSIGLVKGIGGFQLIGDSNNGEAIERIRVLKSRPAQALALMIRDEETFLKMGGTLCDWENLRSPASPIISIKNLTHPHFKKIAPDLNELGVMAPTTPLHFLLFQKDIRALIVTSANPKNYAMPISREEIPFQLGSDIDFIVDHNRGIFRGIDDSVLRGSLVLRKARGLSPCLHPMDSQLIGPKTNLSGSHLEPRTPKIVKNIALGADLKNAMAFRLGDEAIEFPYCGDLKGESLLHLQERSLHDYATLFNVRESEFDESAVDYFSQQLANKFISKAPLPVPHHWAHAWAAYKECPADLVLTFDGTGYDNEDELGGGDGFVLKNRKWHRTLQLKPVKWVGGSSSVIEPWKALTLYFASIDLGPEKLYSYFPHLPQEAIDVFYAYALSSEGLPSTSMGRWFDAAAALIEFGSQRQTYEAQAPIRLEHLAQFYQHQVHTSAFVTELKTKDSQLLEINGAKLLLALIDLKEQAQLTIEQLAFCAHDLMAHSVALACQNLQVKSVTGTGGVFQNELFSGLLKEHLAILNIRFQRPQKSPVNDQSIALGQLYFLEQPNA